MTATLLWDWKKLAWQWLVACIVAGLLQIWFDGIAGWFLGITGFSGAMSGGIAIAFVLAAFRLFSGAIGGAVQNWVLKQWLPHLRYWVMATSIGSAIAFLTINILWRLTQTPAEPGVLGILMPPMSIIPTFVLEGIAGLVLGTAQWLVLRSRLYQAIWWIPVSGLGMAVANIGARGLQQALGGRLTGFDFGFYAANPVFWAITALSTVLYAALTGSFLIWSLRHQA